MRSRIFLLLTLVLFVFVAWTFAEPIVEKPFDVEKVEWLFLTGLGGIGVKAATELLKRWLRIPNERPGSQFNLAGLSISKAVIISIVVSMASVAYWFVFQVHSFNVGYFIVYSILVALMANGLYKSSKPQT